MTLFALATFAAACGTSVDLGGSGAAVDGGPLQCGTDVAPSVDAPCRACDKAAAGCQPNGCYGGYWCDAVYGNCEPPPKTCQ